MDTIPSIPSAVIDSLLSTDHLPLFQQAVRRLPDCYGRERLTKILSTYKPDHPSQLDVRTVRRDLYIALNGLSTPLVCDKPNPFQYLPEVGVAALHAAGALQTAAATHAGTYLWRKAKTSQHRCREADLAWEAINALIEAEKAGNVIAESNRWINGLVENMCNIVEYRHEIQRHDARVSP